MRKKLSLHVKLLIRCYN